MQGRQGVLRLSCGFERLKRAGLYEEVYLGDPFDLDGEVFVKLTEEDWQFFNAKPTKQEVHIHLQRRRGLELTETMNRSGCRCQQ